MIIISEIWLCPPDCELEHEDSDVADMFAIQSCDLNQLMKYGLRPSRRDRWRSFYRCQAVQDMAYSFEVPIIINWHGLFRWQREGYISVQTITMKEKKQRIKRGSPRRQALEKPGFVYLFYWSGMHKIGLSRDVNKRADNLIKLPGLPKADVLHQIATKDMHRTERWLHKKYREYLIEGEREWFRLPDSAVEWICALKDGEIDGIYSS